MVGRSLGPYRVLDRLGAGGMGEVFLAEDTRLGRRVALKSLTDTTLSSPDARQRLHREARAAAALNHPHIAAIYDVLEVEGRPVIVMEYVEGETLAAALGRGPMPLERALDIGVQLAGALAAAHAGGVVHRDLKPGNVCVTPDGRVKVLDFGLAKTAPPVERPAGPSSLTHAGQILGTPGYASPEQLSGAPVDGRADIYGAGVLLYELLTGRFPFAATDAMGLALATMTETPRPVSEVAPHVPAEVSRSVARAMAKNPADRQASAAELRAELARAVARLRERATGMVEEVGGPAGARPRWLRSRAALAVACLVLLAAIGIPLVRYWTGPPRSATPEQRVVAVLPFETSLPEDEPLGAGIADMIVRDLSTVAGLSVVARAATLGYAPPHRDLMRVARELDVAHVLDGALARNGDALSLTLRLTSSLAREPVWTGRYRGAATDPLRLQRQAADELLQALDVGGEAAVRARPVPTTSVQAFEHYAQARNFLDRRDIPGGVDRAVALFESAVALDPTFALAYAGLGEAYWQTYIQTRDAAWTEKARDATLEALALDPDQPQVRYTLAVIRRGTGQTDRAIEELEHANRLQPNDAAHRLLGEILAARGRMDEALGHFQQAIALRPNFWENYAALGAATLAAGRYDEAEAALRRVTELQPDNAWGYQMMGTLYHMRGDVARAQQNYERSIQREPNAHSYSNLATLHYEAGRFEEAAAAFEEAVSLDPNDPRFHRNLGDSYRRLGRAASARSAYLSATEKARAMLAVNPRDARTLSLLALCQGKLGRHETALRDIAEAVGMAPANPEVLYREAVVFAMAGRNAEALQSLRSALDAGFSVRQVAAEEEFRALRESPEFQTMIGQP